MRLASLLLAGAAIAACAGADAARPKRDPNIPFKVIKIINNSNTTLYPVLFQGARPVDEWMQSWFKVGAGDIKKDKYGVKNTYRSFVIEDQGMAPNTTVYVQVPFYAELVPNPDPTKDDQYVDWWNGGRVLFYLDKEQIKRDYKNQTLIVPQTSSLAWCTTLNTQGNACESPHPLNLFYAAGGFPADDLSQLTEYTFGDAITANGAPYPFELGNVGYNISSVDQSYLPIAMQPHGNPNIPYIGSGLSLTEFETAANQFLTDFPGWPIYKGSEANPRIPGAYNVFAAPQDLTAPGKTVNQMRKLYDLCTGGDNSYTCTQYRKVVALFQANFDAYEKLACHDPSITFDTTILAKLYGWVAYNEGCGADANALRTSVTKKKFDQLLNIYIQDLQYSTTKPRFNPYVDLIHSTHYLNEAAYAFSVDDAIGYQHWRGNGLILSFAGTDGLDNPTPMDPRDQVTVTLGSPKKGGAEWVAYGLCSGKPNYGQFENKFWSVAFFPPKFPCRFTASDSTGALYQFGITAGPQSKGGLQTTCPDNISDPAWCNPGVQVVGPQQINTPGPN